MRSKIDVGVGLGGLVGWGPETLRLCQLGLLVTGVSPSYKGRADIELGSQKVGPLCFSRAASLCPLLSRQISQSSALRTKSFEWLDIIRSKLCSDG